MIRFYLCVFVLLVTSSSGWAGEFIYDTTTGQRYSLPEFAHLRSRGEILVFGEQHAVSGQEEDRSTIVHHANQVRLLQALTAVGGFHVTTAMEFLTYTRQPIVDQYLAGALSESDFLQQVGWSSGNPFAFYRAQILEPLASGGHTVALNIPSSIAGHVARGGPESLTADERALLPPIWERGGERYFERFKAVMEDGGHIPADAVDRYFWAQSLWDDTMAWNALKNLNLDSEALTVIIVGEFHVDFGQGLPARLRRQQPGVAVKTLLQVEAPSLDEAVVAPLLVPDAVDGAHADYLWVHTLD